MIALAAILVGLLPQDPPAPPSQPKIDAAVERGARFLLKELRLGARDVKHPDQGQMGLEELALYAIAHGGLDLSRESAHGAALERILSKELRWTYGASLIALALESIDKVKHQWRIAQCGQFLVDNQCVNGQWSYGKTVKMPSNIPTGPSKDAGGSSSTVASIRIARRGRGPPNGDNSNSQYAVLGLRACASAGVQIPDEVLKDALTWWERAQNKDGGWGYATDGQANDPSHGSMSAGGVASVIICRHLLKFDLQKPSSIKRGFDWLGSNFDIKENPRYERPYQWHHYWLYAVERAGVLQGTEQMGSHAWFAEGAHHLLGSQLANGSWLSGTEKFESIGGAVADTAFAILFLRRATKPLPKVITGK
jgi:hypothetical protein